jgi:hypothetical protein
MFKSANKNLSGIFLFIKTTYGASSKEVTSVSKLGSIHEHEKAVLLNKSQLVNP